MTVCCTYDYNTAICSLLRTIRNVSAEVSLKGSFIQLSDSLTLIILFSYVRIFHENLHKVVSLYELGSW